MSDKTPKPTDEERQMIARLAYVDGITASQVGAVMDRCPMQCSRVARAYAKQHHPDLYEALRAAGTADERRAARWALGSALEGEPDAA